MYALHGYQANAVGVSTDLVLEHKHEESRAHAARLLEASAGGDQQFSNYHHIVDTQGRRRTVLVVGESGREVSRATAQRLARGFMVDVTEDENDSIRRALDRARHSAASIQQSTGLLMGSLGVSEQAAFAVLQRVSQHHNVKVRDLARRFMAAAVSTASHSARDLSDVLLGQAAALAVHRSGAAGFEGETPTVRDAGPA